MKKYSIILISLVVLIGCQGYTDFTTYFNTFYNAEKLMKESEEEFEFQDEKQRITPRVFVIEPEIYFPNLNSGGIPPFLNEFIVKQQKRQAVQQKLDSVIIKGSKILSTKGKSNYIEKTLFLMAKTYFYREEWRPSAVKCGEMLDRYPEGDLSPDAALLMAKNFLIERNFFAGKQLLSQTVDLAWLKGRYDILSEAFRLQAELALFENNLQEAMRPYKQAIVQTDDEVLKAKWQIDLAALLYRCGKLEMASEAFKEVRKYKADYLGDYESKLYLAACYNRMKRFREAEEILTDLENDGKYKEWAGNTFTERMVNLRMQKKDTLLEKAEKYSDTAFVNVNYINIHYFEKGMEQYKNNDYAGALRSFAKSKGAKSIVFQTSFEMFKLLSDYDSKISTVSPMLKKINSTEEVTDTIKQFAAYYLYEIARIHEKLKNYDSSLYYYNQARLVCPENNQNAAKFNYAYYFKIKNKNPQLADSLQLVIAEKYSKTEYGRAMMKELGMVEEYVIDTAAETYSSGNKFKLYKDYNSAKGQYLKVYNLFPQSGFAAKSLYAIGWLFEKDLRIIDSAIFYYRILLEKYPTTEYAKDIRVSSEYYALIKSGAAIPDSLKTQRIEDLPKVDVRQEAESVNASIKRFDSIPKNNTPGNPFNINLDPGQLFKKGEEMISKPLDNLPKVSDIPKIEDIPGAAKDFFFKNDKKDSTATPPPADTTKTNIPPKK